MVFTVPWLEACRGWGSCWEDGGLVDHLEDGGLDEWDDGGRVERMGVLLSTWTNKGLVEQPAQIN